MTLAFLVSIILTLASGMPRERLSLDPGWRFAVGKPDSGGGVEVPAGLSMELLMMTFGAYSKAGSAGRLVAPGYDDLGWRRVCALAFSAVCRADPAAGDDLHLGSEIYVCASAPDSDGDGTSGKPFRTLEQAQALRTPPPTQALSAIFSKNWSAILSPRNAMSL